MNPTLQSILSTIGIATVGAVIFFFILNKFSQKSKRYHVHKNGGILITGCSTGIGKHTAQRLSEMGYIVYAGVRNEKDANMLRRECNDNVVPVIVDVAKEEQIDNALEFVKSDLSKRDIPFVSLVNNAGIFYTAPLEFSNMKKVKQLFDVNVFGLVNITQKFSPLIRENKARIINVGSIAGVVVPPLYAIYSASKMAVEAISDAARLEYAEWGSSVSVIEPGFVKTALYNNPTATTSSHNCVASDLSNEEVKVYEKIIQGERKKLDVFLDQGSTEECVSDAIIDAIKSPTPLSRYPVGNYNGKHVSKIKLANNLPDRIMDKIKLVVPPKRK